VCGLQIQHTYGKRLEFPSIRLYQAQFTELPKSHATSMWICNTPYTPRPTVSPVTCVFPATARLEHGGEHDDVRVGSTDRTRSSNNATETRVYLFFVLLLSRRNPLPLFVWRRTDKKLSGVARPRSQHQYPYQQANQAAAAVSSKHWNPAGGCGE